MTIGRRSLTALVAIVPIAMAPLIERTLAGVSHPHYLVLVGTYTSATQSKGIYAYDFDATSGKLTEKGIAAESPDPSFLITHPSGKFVYAVNEAGTQSTIRAFALDAENGRLTLVDQLPALGEHPSYLSFDKTGKFLLVTNYIGGTVAVFPVLPDGSLGEHTDLVEDTGTLGPNTGRQEAPHPHWVEVSANNRFAYVADLGVDRIFIYKFDAAKGTLAPKVASSVESVKPGDPVPVVLRRGTGPRHAVLSPNGHFMYVLGELGSTVTVLTNDGHESFRNIQELSTLPPGFTGRNEAAEIALHPNGKWLYASNRGRDTIAIFAVDAVYGTLDFFTDISTGGQKPRHFAIDPTGRYLLAENQDSDSIVEFCINASTGALTLTREGAHLPSPVYLVFYPIK